MGRFPANVLNDTTLKENLISANPFLDAGFKISIEGTNGVITNASTNETFPISRIDNKWIVKLKDIEQMQCFSADNIPSHEINEILDIYNASVTKPTETIINHIIKLHERMGHASLKNMIMAIEGDNPSWLHCDLSVKDIRHVMQTYKCPHCILGKKNKPPIPLSSGDRVDVAPGEIISGDIVGKIQPATTEGHCYYFLFVDVATGYMHAFTSKSKTEFIPALEKVIAWYKNHKCTPKVFRSDSEILLNSKEMSELLNHPSVCMTSERSAPYTHYQNIVERYVQTCNKGVATMIHAQRFLPANTWNLALYNWIRCQNHTPNSKSCPRTPHHVITGNQTNLSKQFQFAFGDILAVRIPPELRTWKFDLKYSVGIYVGQPEGSVDSAQVYSPFDRKIYTRTDVINIDLTDEQFSHYAQKRTNIQTNHPITTLKDSLAFDFNLPPQQVLNETPSVVHQLPLFAPTDTLPQPRPKKIVEQSDRVLRSMTAHEVSVNMASASVKSNLLPKLTLRTALQSSEGDKWKEAIQSEMYSLIDKTNTLVPEIIDTTKEYIIIHTTMQLKLKMLDATTIDKYKARCCGCGNELSEIIMDKYSPTISSLAHSIVHQLSIIDQMYTCTIDTVGAYLNQEYPEDAIPLYVTLPRLVAEVCDLPANQTYRVRKYIYGLPDSGRAYYDAYRSHLIANGYNPTGSDPCLFTKIDGNHRTYVWFHVDDTFVASTRKSALIDLQECLKTRFEITINEEIESYLGVNMEKLQDGSVRLTQPKLLQQLFDEYEVHLLPGLSTANAPQRQTPRRNIEVQPVPRQEYLHLVGTLNYLTKSRPEIATAISFGAMHCQEPTTEHFEDLMHCVKYLYNTREKGLTLRPQQSDSSELQLRCYVDASYLTHDDSKSHTGYCLSFGSIGTFYSKSKKQPLVTTSSTHAEMRALYEVIVDIIFTINLCEELQRPLKLPAIILEDNQPAIELSKELSSRVKKCKHFLMLVNFIREQVASGLVEIQKVATQDNIADILTKIVNGQDFRRKSNLLLGLDDNDN